MNLVRCAVLVTLAIASAAEARVLSYAPYTDRVSIPAVQSRLNRHFVLVEQAPPPFGAPSFPFNPSQVVLYDSKGVQEPRVIFPQDGSTTLVNNAIAREDEREVPVVLIETTAGNQGTWILSNDGGATWTKVPLPSIVLNFANTIDTGGAFVRGRFSSLLVGTREVPFVVAFTAAGTVTIYGVTFDGSVKQLASFPASTTGAPALLGRDATGGRFLVQGAGGLMSVDVEGKTSPIAPNAFRGTSQGWITADGGAYIEQNVGLGNVVLWYAKSGTATPVAASWEGAPDTTPAINPSWIFYAVPTADSNGAWMIRRGGARPTTFLLHTASAGVVTQWQDVTAPEVEALHPAASGSKVLIQVHRGRQSVDNLLFKDPALAVWRIGDPAPRVFDELFLSETLTKAFVHLDVDRIESGDPFAFDSGLPVAGGGAIISSGGGGSDVVQEWGIVRSSLQQKLVLPSVGRTVGAFGSRWASDLTVYNPDAAPLELTLSFVPTGAKSSSSTRLTLLPKEIRRIADVVGTLFGADNTTGALAVTPEMGRSVNVAGRTYNTVSNGSYGFTMNGIDVFSAAGPRFPVTFAGAFPGSNFRTNVTIADTSGRGTSVNATTAGPYGAATTEAVAFDVSPNSQMQVNFLGPLLGVGASETGALVLRPSRGDTIASVFVIDNRTNDPTFFPPDIPASVVRVIPAIGHLDGANGSKFRSDLYLFNNSSQPKMLTLQAKAWDVPENPTSLPLTLLPYEARVIKDVLLTAFGKTGIARLRYSAQGSSTDTSVRVTSRTYTIDANGGTYGFLMPPLNSFQSGAPGDALEILGATLDPRFRTNLGLVDLSAFPTATAARARVEIFDDRGTTIDNFELSIPSTGGMQVNDLFHARGIAESAKPVLIRVTTIQGMIGAYAASVDNGTNDPAYLAANLAARN